MDVGRRPGSSEFGLVSVPVGRLRQGRLPGPGKFRCFALCDTLPCEVVTLELWKDGECSGLLGGECVLAFSPFLNDSILLLPVDGPELLYEYTTFLLGKAEQVDRNAGFLLYSSTFSSVLCDFIPPFCFAVLYEVLRINFNCCRYYEILNIRAAQAYTSIILVQQY